MHDLGFVDLANTDDGWPYPDSDDDETTERYLVQYEYKGRRWVGLA